MFILDRELYPSHDGEIGGEAPFVARYDVVRISVRPPRLRSWIDPLILGLRVAIAEARAALHRLAVLGQDPAAAALLDRRSAAGGVVRNLLRVYFRLLALLRMVLAIASTAAPPARRRPDVPGPLDVLSPGGQAAVFAPRC